MTSIRIKNKNYKKKELKKKERKKKRRRWEESNSKNPSIIH